MPDIELTSAELEEALTELETHQTQLDMDGIMVGVSRQALDMVITTARAGLEAGKAEESMRERAAELAEKEQAIRIANGNAAKDGDTSWGPDTNAAAMAYRDLAARQTDTEPDIAKVARDNRSELYMPLDEATVRGEEG